MTADDTAQTTLFAYTVVVGCRHTLQYYASVGGVNV
jgi:hypothetical protein